MLSSRPAASWVTPASPGTFCGVRTADPTVPSPSAPYSFPPQAHSDPSGSTANAWREPVTICVAFCVRRSTMTGVALSAVVEPLPSVPA
jgi:hypothetical protein